MPKIKVFVTLYNKLEKERMKKTYDGLLTNEKIVYQEEGKIVTIYKNSNTIKMIRREKNSIITLNFVEKSSQKSTLEMIGLEPLELETETSLLETSNCGFHICYKTRIKEEIMGAYDFDLRYEVKE